MSTPPNFDDLLVTAEDRENLKVGWELIKAGMPVFVAPINPEYRLGMVSTPEFELPQWWQTLGPNLRAIDDWQMYSGLFMVTTHIAVIDAEGRNRAGVDAERQRIMDHGVRILGEVETASRGQHFYVPGVGLPSDTSPDDSLSFRGGGDDIHRRGLVCLPGTSRPAYEMGGYSWIHPIDIPGFQSLTSEDLSRQRIAIRAYLEASGIPQLPSQVPEVHDKGTAPPVNGRTPRISMSESTGGTGGTNPGQGRFTITPLSQIPETQVDWWIDSVLPKRMLAALTGDEGVGKGLFCCRLITILTTQLDANVLLIAGEDDASSVLNPRLRAAGANLDRVHVLSQEDIVTIPVLPNELNNLKAMILERDINVVIIDPWLSTVSPKIQVKDTQQARQYLDPLNDLARSLNVSILLVGHTNRGESTSTRNRYGSTIALRQASRLSLMAVPDPKNPECLLVGVDKSNLGPIGPAQRFTKKVNESGDMYLVEDSNPTGSTIAAFFAERETSEVSPDGRQTHLRSLAQKLLTEQGHLTRQDVINLYVANGSTEGAADKALKRWSQGSSAFLVAEGDGVYSPTGTPPTPRTSGDADTGGTP